DMEPIVGSAVSLSGGTGPEDQGRAAGTRWKRLGSASPGSTWISDAGRRPSVARPRGPSRVSEPSDFERARIVTGAPGVIARASRYDSRPGYAPASSVMP